MAPLDVVAARVRVGEPRGGGDPGRGRGGGGRGRAEARDLQHQRPRDVGHAHRAHRPAHRRALPGRPGRGASRPPSESARTSLAARKSLENAEYASSYAKNQLLPELDLIAGYGTTGLGGTQVLDRGSPASPCPHPIPGGFGQRAGRRLRARLPHLDARRQPHLPDPQPAGGGRRRAGPHQPRPEPHGRVTRLYRSRVPQRRARVSTKSLRPAWPPTRPAGTTCSSTMRLRSMKRGGCRCRSG